MDESIKDTSVAGGSNQPQATSVTSEAITQKLLEESGLISSQGSNIDQSINKAKEGVERATQASSRAIASQYDREIGYAREGIDRNFQSARAAGVGGMQNMAAFRELTSTSDKQLNDLAQRKQELILQNDAIGAQKIADLELQALDYKQKATQQVFNNLLGISGVVQQSEQFKLQQRVQSFQEEQTKGSIALQYGVEALPGESLDQLITRVSPLASADRQLELREIRARINAQEAQTAEIARKVKAGSNLEGLSDESIALGITRGMIDPSDLGYISSNKFQGVMTHFKEQEKEMVTSEMFGLFNSGDSYEEIVQSINEGDFAAKGLSKVDLMDIASKIREEQAKSIVENKPFTLKSVAGALGAGYLQAGVGIAGFLGIKSSLTKEQIKEAKNRTY